MATDTSPQSRFENVDELRDSNGLLAKISRRTKTGELTFAILKEFERDGETETTSFIPFSKIDALEQLVQALKSRCTEINADFTPAKAARGRR
jgi:hypothetical protein